MLVADLIQKFAFTRNQFCMSLCHHLHGGVVHNHAVKRDIGVSSSHFSAALQEQSIAELPVEESRTASQYFHHSISHVLHKTHEARVCAER